MFSTTVYTRSPLTTARHYKLLLRYAVMNFKTLYGNTDTRGGALLTCSPPLPQLLMYSLTVLVYLLRIISSFIRWDYFCDIFANSSTAVNAHGHFLATTLLYLYGSIRGTFKEYFLAAYKKKFTYRHTFMDEVEMTWLGQPKVKAVFTKKIYFCYIINYKWGRYS